MKFAPGTKDSISGKPYFFFSECGKFTVTLPIRDSEPYMAFRKPDPGSRLPAKLLGIFKSAKDAKAACEG